MASKLTAGKDRIRVFGLVRDKDGKPRFDDIKGIPNQLWNMLTENEQQEIKENGGYPSSR